MDTIDTVINGSRIMPPPRYGKSIQSERYQIANAICKPDCPICGGVGLVSQEVPLGHPNFGKLLDCPNIDIIKVYGNRVGITDADRDLDWSAVMPKDNAMDGVNAVRRAISRGYGWVFLWGGVGLAKSLIQKIAVAEAIRNHKQASYSRMVDIIDDLRGSFDAARPSTEGDSRLRWWLDLPVLCIDEFSRLNDTPYAQERRFVVMDKRYESALDKKTVTIIADNTNPASYDPYLFDRIRDGRFEIVKLTGESARPMMEYKNE